MNGKKSIQKPQSKPTETPQTGSVTPLIDLSSVLAVGTEEIRGMLRLLRRAHCSKTVFWEIRLVNLSALNILYCLKPILEQDVAFVISWLFCKGTGAVG